MPADAELPTLVDAARRGDQAAWDRLVERYTPLLWAIARGFGLPPTAAADVAHTSWLRLVESLDDAPAETLGEWVATIARTEAVQALRWVDPRPVRRAAAPDPLWTTVEQLPARCRLALRLLAVTPPVTAYELSAALDLPPDAATEFATDCLSRLARAVAGTTP